MNIRWEHIKQQGWGKTGWDRGHRGEATEGRVELQCLWSFFYSCLLFHILCSPLTFLLHYLLSLFAIPSSTLPSIPRPIPPSHVSVFPELSLFHHPLLHPYPLSFPSLFRFFLIFEPSSSSVQPVCPDIPEDEAQYWTSKLERINTMRIHDEVRLQRSPVNKLKIILVLIKNNILFLHLKSR